MGCVSSKGDINDRHPNVFHVWNVDELGNMLFPGQIQITDSELVLYQKGKEPIRWPMRCLRRYGFDAELFSFESGRRCTTGPGIYAFKCRRAEALFNLLQEHIQNSGQDDVSHASHSFSNNHSSVTGGGSNGVPLTGATNGSILRSGSVSVSDVGNYLEPIVRHRTRSNASRDGFSRMATQSLPSNLAFTDNGHTGANGVTGVNAISINGGPHYVNEDITSLAGIDKDSDSLSQRSPLTPPANLPLLHEYANTAAALNESEIGANNMKTVVVNHGMARISELPQHLPNGTLEENGNGGNFNKVLYSILDLPKNMVKVMKSSNGCRQVVLRGHSLDDNTNYARLDDLLKQEHSAKHLYMNVVPDNSQKNKENNNAVASSQSFSYHDHFYANVGPSGRQKSVESPPASGITLNWLAKESVNQTTQQQQQSQTLTHHQVSRQVNYAILDLNHRGSNSSGGSASNGPSNNGGGGCETIPTSPTTLATPSDCLYRGALEGYATIDFDKTAALSNSANPCLDDDDCVRKTRHNSNISDLLHSKHSSVVGE